MRQRSDDPRGDRHADRQLAQGQAPVALQELALDLQSVAEEDHDQGHRGEVTHKAGAGAEVENAGDARAQEEARKHEHGRQREDAPVGQAGEERAEHQQAAEDDGHGLEGGHSCSVPYGPEMTGEKGHLKVFIGMAPGVGKTYRMLQEGRAEADTGRDVVIGYLETHGRAETLEQGRGPRAHPAAEARLSRQATRGDGPPGRPGSQARALPDRRAGPYQRAGGRAREALRGCASRPRGGDRRLLDRQRPASREPQRRGRPADGRQGSRDDPRRGPLGGRRGRSDRPDPRGPDRPPAGRQGLPPRAGPGGPEQLLQDREPARPCARRPCARSPRTSRSSGSSASRRRSSAATRRAIRSPRSTAPQAIAERLLAIVDLTPESERVVRRAWRSAQRLDGELDVLLVRPPGRPPSVEDRRHLEELQAARLDAGRSPAGRGDRGRRLRGDRRWPARWEPPTS